MQIKYSEKNKIIARQLFSRVFSPPVSISFVLVLLISSISLGANIESDLIGTGTEWGGNVVNSNEMTAFQNYLGSVPGVTQVAPGSNSAASIINGKLIAKIVVDGDNIARILQYVQNTLSGELNGKPLEPGGPGIVWNPLVRVANSVVAQEMNAGVDYDTIANDPNKAAVADRDLNLLVDKVTLVLNQKMGLNLSAYQAMAFFDPVMAYEPLRNLTVTKRFYFQLDLVYINGTQPRFDSRNFTYDPTTGHIVGSFDPVYVSNIAGVLPDAVPNPMGNGNGGFIANDQIKGLPNPDLSFDAAAELKKLRDLIEAGKTHFPVIASSALGQEMYDFTGTYNPSVKKSMRELPNSSTGGPLVIDPLGDPTLNELVKTNLGLNLYDSYLDTVLKLPWAKGIYDITALNALTDPTSETGVAQWDFLHKLSNGLKDLGFKGTRTTLVKNGVNYPGLLVTISNGTKNNTLLHNAIVGLLNRGGGLFLSPFLDYTELDLGAQYESMKNGALQLYNEKGKLLNLNWKPAANASDYSPMFITTRLDVFLKLKLNSLTESFGVLGHEINHLRIATDHMNGILHPAHSWVNEAIDAAHFYDFYDLSELSSFTLGLGVSVRSKGPPSAIVDTPISAGSETALVMANKALELVQSGQDTFFSQTPENLLNHLGTDKYGWAKIEWGPKVSNGLGGTASKYGFSLAGLKKEDLAVNPTLLLNHAKGFLDAVLLMANNAKIEIANYVNDHLSEVDKKQILTREMDYFKNNPRGAPQPLDTVVYTKQDQALARMWFEERRSIDKISKDYSLSDTTALEADYAKNRQVTGAKQGTLSVNSDANYINYLLDTLYGPNHPMNDKMNTFVAGLKKLAADINTKLNSQWATEMREAGKNAYLGIAGIGLFAANGLLKSAREFQSVPAGEEFNFMIKTAKSALNEIREMGKWMAVMTGAHVTLSQAAKAKWSYAGRATIALAGYEVVLGAVGFSAIAFELDDLNDSINAALGVSTTTANLLMNLLTPGVPSQLIAANMISVVPQTPIKSATDMIKSISGDTSFLDYLAKKWFAPPSAIDLGAGIANDTIKATHQGMELVPAEQTAFSINATALAQAIQIKLNMAGDSLIQQSGSNDSLDSSALLFAQCKSCTASGGLKGVSSDFLRELTRTTMDEVAKNPKLAQEFVQNPETYPLSKQDGGLGVKLKDLVKAEYNSKNPQGNIEYPPIVGSPVGFKLGDVVGLQAATFALSSELEAAFRQYNALSSALKTSSKGLALQMKIGKIILERAKNIQNIKSMKNTINQFSKGPINFGTTLGQVPIDFSKNMEQAKNLATSLTLSGVQTVKVDISQQKTLAQVLQENNQEFINSFIQGEVAHQQMVATYLYQEKVTDDIAQAAAQSDYNFDFGTGNEGSGYEDFNGGDSPLDLTNGGAGVTSDLIGSMKPGPAVNNGTNNGSSGGGGGSSGSGSYRVTRPYRSTDGTMMDVVIASSNPLEVGTTNNATVTSYSDIKDLTTGEIARVYLLNNGDYISCLDKCFSFVNGTIQPKADPNLVVLK